MTSADGLASWYTEEQAAQKLGISPRSFRRLIADGKSREYAYAPEKRNRPRNGKKPEPVFNPEEVDALAQAANTRIVPAGFQPSKAPDDIPPALALALRLVERMKLLNAPPPAEKLYLTIPEAAQVSGLSHAFIRRNAARIGFKDGNTWKIPRTSLANNQAMSKLARLGG